MRYKTTTAAAEYLCISQSAVSKQLANLRKITDDVLFQKIGSEFRPTQRAITLHVYTKKALALMDEGLNPTSSFDYSEAERKFVIATTDYFKSVVLHRYLDKLAMAASSVKLELIDLPLAFTNKGLVKTNHLSKLLDSGDIDLIIHPDSQTFATTGVDQQIDHKELLSDEWVLAINTELASSLDDVQQFMENAEYVKVNLPGLEGQLFNTLSFKRNIKLEVDNLGGVLEVIANTDCAAILPSKLISSLKAQNQVTSVKLPFELEPFTHHMIWHENAVNQQDQIFLRQSLLNVCSRM